MVKYFCDECGEEVTGPMLATSLNMTGKVLCSEHYKKHQEVMEKYGHGWTSKKDDPKDKVNHNSYSA